MTKLTVDSPIPYTLSDLTNAITAEMGLLNKATDTAPFMRLKTKIDELKADPRYHFMFSGMLVSDSMPGLLAKLFRLPNGGTIGTHEDCTEQRQLSRKLASTTQFLESVLDNVPVCVAAKNIEDGRYIFVNRAFERFSRFSRDHILGKRADEIFQAETAAGIAAAVTGVVPAVIAGPPLGALAAWAFVSRRASVWYRHFDEVLADVSARRTRLVTRNGKEKQAQFPEVVAALRSFAASIGHAVVLDGEGRVLAGAIAGRALYDGRLDPKEALALVRAA